MIELPCTVHRSDISDAAQTSFKRKHSIAQLDYMEIGFVQEKPFCSDYYGLLECNFLYTVNRIGMDFESHTYTQKPHYHLHLCMANRNEQDIPQLIKAEK